VSFAGCARQDFQVRASRDSTRVLRVLVACTLTELLTMMQRAGQYTTAEKVDRIYENMRTEYKFFVRLGDQTDLADLMDQAAEYEDLKKAQGKKYERKSARSTPLLL